MIKIFYTILFSSTLFSFSINELKNDFYNNVVLKNIYNEYNTTKEKIEAVKFYKKVSTFTNEEKEKMYKMILDIVKNKNINNDEYFSIVNLNKQLYTVLLYLREPNSIYIIGHSLITSGDIKKELTIKYGEDHFFDTPTGLYNVKRAWRSDGKYKPTNKTVQSYGSKGRFIYYFGKENAKRYYIYNKYGKKQKKYKLITDTLNFAIHSYNSNDKRGYKNSHGCVRLSDELNLFLENNLVLHKNFFKNNKWHLKYSNKPKNIKNENIKGSYVLIINSLN